MSDLPSATVPRALIQWDESGNPYAPHFDDVYRPRGAEAARAQVQHVFLGGNGLPGRWQGRSHFVILEAGFGLGTNFLATWQAWKEDPHRSERLTYIGLEGFLPSAGDLIRAHREQPWSERAQSLCAQWPAPLRNVHVMDFDDDRVRLLLCLGEVRHTWPQVVAQVDAFYLDGFAPSRNPDMWDSQLLRQMTRLAAPHATASTWSAARRVREALTQAGFQVDKAPGSGSKRDMTVARFAPVFQASPPPGRRPSRMPSTVRRADHVEATSDPADALVVGAGLAGAAIARALGRRGLHVQVLSQGATIADGASGNPAGLYHGTWHRSDGHHARLLRACALWAHRKYHHLVSTHQVTGQCQGLARLGNPPQPSDPHAPAEYAQWLSASEVTQWTHTRASQGAWRYTQAGWVNPSEVVRHDLLHPRITLRTGLSVDSIERQTTEPGAPWVLKDTRGQVCARATLIIFANGTGISPVLAAWGWEGAISEIVRGQVSWLRDAMPVSHPMAGEGYALRLSPDRLMCGASSQLADQDTAVRHDDHLYNLQRLQRLTGSTAQAIDIQGGRTAFRLNTWDKLPLVGPWPDIHGSLAHRTDQARMWPRLEGLYVMAGLGGRGLTWAPLMSELLAAWITGEPWPLEADLVDAVDPARWPVRTARQISALKSDSPHP